MPTYQVSRGFEYFYLHTPPSPSSSSAKYVLFLHGWPSVSHEWHYQIDHFRKLGYGIIVPDLLGSGRTSRPAQPEKYLLKDMAKDMIEILDHENIARVDAVGHDWGSHLLGRVAVYYPERLGRICFIAVGYRPPGAPTNLDAINEMTAQKLGYAIFGYQVFFTQDEKAEAILNQHKDSMMSLIYTADPILWKEHMGPLGALEKWLKADKQTEWAPFLTEEDHSSRRDNITETLGGMPTLNWYKANARNLNYEAEKDLPEEKKHLAQPTLFISAAKDYIALPTMQLPAMEPWIPRLAVEDLDTAHWAQLEAADRVNELLQKFFGGS